MSKKKDFTQAVSIKIPPALPPIAPAPIKREHSVDAIPSMRGEVRQIDIDRIVPSRYQPRHYFNNIELQELAVSITKKGVLQPISVCRVGEGNFELIAGERRWRASKIAGLLKIPAIVYDQRPDVDELGLIENIQREDLLPEETAIAIAGIMERHHYNQQEVAAVIGKEKSDVSKFCTIAAFARNDAVRTFLTTARDGSNTSVSKELLYMAASRPTIEEGLSFLKNAIDQAMNVKTARETIKAASGKKTSRKSHPGIISYFHSFNKKLLPEHAERISSKEEASAILEEITKTVASLTLLEKNIQHRFTE